MPQDQDFKRLVRTRMTETGERYTQARAALRGPANPGDDGPDDRLRSLVGQLAVPTPNGSELVPFAVLEGLPENERRAAAVWGLSHESWRVRRNCARLLDDVSFTPVSLAALTRALDDPHPKVRRAVAHSLSCQHCKPDGCAVDTRTLFERIALDPSRQVREIAVFTCSWAFHDQWAHDLLVRAVQSDPSPQLREQAQKGIEYIRSMWAADAARRRLPEEVRARTERHRGRWIAVHDGRVVAVRNGQRRVFRRALHQGATAYWVAPEDATPVSA